MRYLVIVTEVDKNEQFVKVLHMLLISDVDELLKIRNRIQKHYGSERVRMKTYTENELIELLGLYDI